MMPAFEIGLIRMHVHPPTRDERLLCLRDQFDLQHIHNRLRNLILDREDVGQLAIVTLRPEMATVGDSDQSASWARSCSKRER